MELQVVGPISGTGYGVVTANLTAAMTRSEHTIRLVQLGRGDWGWFAQPVQGGIAAAIAAERLRSESRPDFTLGIWHEWDHPPEVMDPVAKRGTYVAMPTFELDRVRPAAVNCLRDVRVIVSSAYCQSVLRAQGVKADMVHFHGVDAEIFKPDAFKPVGKMIMLNVGKLELRKGHDLCIRLLARGLKLGWRVSLWGMWSNPFISQGQFQSQMDRWIAEAAAAENVSSETVRRGIYLVGQKPRPTDVAACMNLAHIGVFPYRAEGWNLPLLEALACGLPVIATSVTGPLEYLSSENASLIGAEPAPADDGVFFGPGRLEGMWWEPSFEQLVGAAERMYEAWLSGSLRPNEAGVRTASGLSWTAAAEAVIRCLAQG